MLKYLPLFFIAAPLLCSCASVYHIDLALGQSNYYEKYDEPLDQSLATTFGAPVTITSGDNNKADLAGFSVRAGITEEINGFWVTRISYFKDQFEPLTLSYDVQGQDSWDENLKLTGSGVEVDFGINLWIFRPEYVYKKMSGTTHFQLTDTTTGVTSEAYVDDNFVFKGPGICIDIPFSDSFHMYVEKQMLEGEGSMAKSTIDTTLLGFRFGGWGNGKKSSK